MPRLCSPLFSFDQHHALRRDRLLLTNRPHHFTGLGLDPYPCDVDGEQFGDPVADRCAVREDFGPLGENHAIQVNDLPASVGHPFEGRPEHLGRIPPLVGRIGVGKQFADVTQASGAEEGVGDGMEEDIGIAVTQRHLLMGDRHAPEHEPVAGPEAVRIVSQSDSDHRCHLQGSGTVFTYTPAMHNSSPSHPSHRPSEQPSAGGKAVLSVSGLTKEYRVYDKPEGLLASVTGLFHRKNRVVEALKGVDLEVGKGEFVAMLGPNGAGKTTFLKLLSGIITPTRGTARVLGHVPWERTDDFRRRFALVMGQRNQLWWDLPAAESFRLHKEIYRIETRAFERTRDELVDLLGVRKLLLQPVRDLSLGERMKLELVAALLHEPEVLFLDEPTIGLDVVAQHALHRFLAHVQAERQMTVILTTHYMKDVAALCQRLVVVTEGSILYDGSLGQIVDRFTSHKIVTLDFDAPPEASRVERFGFPAEIRGPQVILRIDRTRIADALPGILREEGVRDVSVEDVPLEEIVAQLFRSGTSDAAGISAPTGTPR